MTIIAVNTSDAGQAYQRWAVPADEHLNKTPISRGIRLYRGTVAVPALGASDTTQVNLNVTFPIPYVYLPKALTLSFGSDDTTESFETNGLLRYNQGLNGSVGEMLYAIPSLAIVLGSTQLATRIWSNPTNGVAWRNFINGERLDHLTIAVSDLTDTSTAGDVAWNLEFWEYDAEQCLNWEVNLQQQVIGP